MYKSIEIDKIKFINKKNEITFAYFDGSPVLFQGSKGFLNKQISNETQYIWIHYLNETPRKQNMFKNLENFKLKLEKNMDNKIHPFYHENGIGSFTQHYNNKIILDIYINQDNVLDKLDEFPDKCYCYPLIWFSGLKKKGDRWYIVSKLIQLMIFPIYLKFNKCLIDTFEEKKMIEKTIEDDDKITYLTHPLYGKYFKMINMGIPKMAVIIKIKNELGNDFISIMDNNPNEYITIHKIKRCDHSYFSKFFKMLKMGIPRMAIEQKMNIENVEINILENPNEIILDIPIIKNNINEMIVKKKLNSILPKIDKKRENKIVVKTNNHPQIDLTELMNKRMLMLNKQI
jgi:hypothetical protein